MPPPPLHQGKGLSQPFMQDDRLFIRVLSKHQLCNLYLKKQRQLCWHELRNMFDCLINRLTLTRCEIFSILNCLGAVRFFFFLFAFTYGFTVKCGFAHARLEQASVSKSFAREGESARISPYMFSKQICGETHARQCLEAISQAIVRCSWNFLKIARWESTGRLVPNGRKTSIITVSTRR